MSFAKSSVRSKIALVCLVFAIVLHIVGFATTAWFILELTFKIESSTVVVTVQIGLWKLCSCAETLCVCINISSASGWFLAAEILESVGLGLLFTSGITTIVKLCGKSTNPYTIAGIRQLFASGILITIGVALYGTNKERFNDFMLQQLSLSEQKAKFQVTGLHLSTGYSLILCAVASGICLLVCLPLLMLDQRHNKRADLQLEISCEMKPYPAVTRMDGQHLLADQSLVTVENTTLGSSRQAYGKQSQYPSQDQFVALHGKACVGDQYPPPTQLYMEMPSKSYNPS